MYKKNLILIIALVFALSACKNNRQPQGEQISVSILPQKYFVEQIAGDDFTVNVMLPPGASPADFEPTARQVQNLNNSISYFYIGHLGFERSWMKRFSETAQDVNYISCSQGIDLLRGPVEDHGDHKHHGTDPHIWTSPENVKTISRTIYKHLTELYPAKKEEYAKNLEHFISRIDTLDNDIRKAIRKDSVNRAFMIFHPSLSYFARDYHLEQLSIEFEGKSPSTAHMAKMTDLAKEKKINTIFVQTQFETSKAKAVAEEINARVVAVDPLAENWLQEMYSITEKLAKSFNGKTD